MGKAEIILVSGEILPVTVVGDAHITPIPAAVQSGEWIPLDEFIDIRDTDLTEEQARQARFFIQQPNDHTEKL